MSEFTDTTADHTRELATSDLATSGRGQRPAGLRYLVTRGVHAVVRRLGASLADIVQDGTQVHFRSARNPGIHGSVIAAKVPHSSPAAFHSTVALFRRVDLVVAQDRLG